MRYEAKFTPTVDDVLTAIHMHNQRKDDDNLKLCLYIGIGLAIVFGIAAYFLHFLALGIAGIFMGVFMPIAPRLMRWTMETSIRMEDNIRRRSKKFAPEEFKLCLTEDGVEFSNSVVQSSNNLVKSKNTWDEITKVLLDERGVLLYIGSQGYYFFIPAGAFVGGYFPLEELKSLVSHKK
jgi:hypothetical protein